ncbi:CHAP domain-containing protein [Streptosporangium sp. NBC_01639]|uniref:CHAP domain-containing protein n=1 Tax=Streptosporangium sp. NBC_01639 TaxID=2975948 RepID=UPI00386E4F3C|nr:CHAP domain-containing protein [Streptosporangium sp. NBC_01639]
MDPIGDDLLRVMEPKLGYKEQPGQHTTFGQWYATNVVKDSQYRTAPWCDMVIAWAAGKAGVEDFVGQFAWTPSHARWFEARGAWSRKPEPGALVFFDWSGGKDIGGIDHVGLIERVDGGTLHTIEGNVDGIWLKRKTRDESKVVGYGLPRKVKQNLESAATKNVAVARADGPGEARPTAAAGSAAVHPGPTVPETAPVAALLLLVLGATFILARRRSRASAAGRSSLSPAERTPAPPPGLPRVPATGRHRRRASAVDSKAVDPKAADSKLEMKLDAKENMQADTGPDGGGPPAVPVWRPAPRPAVRHVRRRTPAAAIGRPCGDGEEHALQSGVAEQAHHRRLRFTGEGVPVGGAGPPEARAGRRPYSSGPGAPTEDPAGQRRLD